MGGISSSVGLISGIDTGRLIEQLLAIEARPRTLFQRRAIQLQSQQSAYLDLNSRLGALRTASAAFRVNKVFGSMKATSSDPLVLSATASNAAVPGSYNFIVDQLVTNQQLLSGGFSDLTASPVGASSFVIEDARGRLDRDTLLSDLNTGEGIARGKIVITQGAASETIDLSKAVTVSDVLSALNSAATVSIQASVKDGAFVVESTNATSFSITNATGYTTASSLGLTGVNGTTSTQGSGVYALGNAMSLSALNDGNGVFINSLSVGTARFDFSIAINNEAAVKVNLGTVYEDQGEAGVVAVEGPAKDMGEVIDRINAALSAAGYTQATASIAPDGSRLRIVDTLGRSIAVAENGTGTTAKDLGFSTTGSATGTMTGSRILAGLNTTLARNLLGGSGTLGDGTMHVTARDGTTFNFSLNLDASIDQIIAQFNAETSGKVTLSIGTSGTGLVAKDTTGSTSSNLIIYGNDSIEGASTAVALGIDTGMTGVNAASKKGTNLQHRYVAASTMLSSLNGGRGVGTGKFRLTDSLGNTATVDIDTDSRTVGDVIDEINSRNLRLKARVNANGDGIEIFEQIPPGGTAGSVRMKIEDSTGSVASSLRIVGEAKGTGTANMIDGSYEKSIEFAATETLQQVVSKINEAGAGLSAAVVNTGVGSKPFKLSLTSLASGTSGRFTIDTGSLNLDFTTLDAGRDSRVFFGSADPASAVLLTSSSNSLDGVLQGVNIDLTGTSVKPVSLTITRDTATIETKIKDFVSAFNDVASRVTFHTRYDKETQVRGALLGDGSAIALRDALFSTLRKEVVNGSGSVKSLTDVGLTVGDGGKLEFSSDTFRAALESDPKGVEEVFQLYNLKPKTNLDLGNGVSVNNPDAPDEFNAIGVMGQIEQLAKQYVDSSKGILTLRGNALGEQVRLQQDRIAAFDRRLESRRAFLIRQFTGMETALAQLQSQSSALASLGSLGRL